MLDLPMLAFKIKGIDEYVELTIEEVCGFPNATDYGGGYGARGILKIQVAQYFVSATHYFTTGELYRFASELNRCYESLNGVATLENVERELELQCEFNRLGHVNISGKIQADQSVKNILEFELKTDQTQIKDLLLQLKKVINIFGDNEGKDKNIVSL